MNQTSIKESNRLASLDILRGADLFLLTFFQPVLLAFNQKLEMPFLNKLVGQFHHVEWVGFHLWDLVMPLFMFMAGVSMPFSFSKYRTASDKWPIYRRIFKRVVLLFVLGMVVQGNLLALDPKHIYLYTNTLQAIAVGYLIASIILLHCTFKWQVIVTAALLLLYWASMTFLGDFTQTGNFAEQVDRWVLGRFRDGVSWSADGTWHFSPTYTYTWIVSSLTFGVTVMLGVFAGKVMKNGRDNRKGVVKKLLLIGVALMAIAGLWSLQMPIIKHLWTCSMTLFSGGCCFVLMAIFYYWIDYKGYNRGLNWLKIYGMNSIMAYLLAEVVNFRSVAASLTFGLEQYLGDYYTAWLTLANYLILFFILRMMYKCNLFLKV